MGSNRVISLHLYAWSSGYHWALFTTNARGRKVLQHHEHVTDETIDELDDPYEAILLAALEAYRKHGHR